MGRAHAILHPGTIHDSDIHNPIDTARETSVAGDPQAKAHQ
jgi:hypothetical protein